MKVGDDLLKVIVTDHNYMDFENERILFAATGAELQLYQCQTEEEVIDVAKGAIGIINSDIPITRKIIESLPDLKVIAKYGIGVDEIDVEAADEYGVYIANVPDYCQDEVANHTLTLILALNRKIIYYNQQVKNGNWGFDVGAPLHRFNTQTVGLISYGGIARLLSQKLQALGFKVIAYDPLVEKSGQVVDVKLVKLEELMMQSDIISIHAPLIADTHHLINKRMLALSKKSAVIVNAGRGSVIKETDLIQALMEKTIAGAALDVLEDEPIIQEHPFLTMDNVILTPHVAFYTEESMNELKEKTVDNILDVLNGGRPRYAVNNPKI